jgi:hypothetical protein
MTNESGILFDNIRRFRGETLLTEGVNDDMIVDAINNHQYLYIYYAGDGSNKSGYRTIRPYVLGTNKNGRVLRAWQDNPNSVTFQNRPTRPDDHRHDWWADDHFGGVKPGWRFFRVDKISKAYPTGEKFNDEQGKVIIPPDYHEGGDDDMMSIIAYVSSKTEPEFVPREVPAEPRKGKWVGFMKADAGRYKKAMPPNIINGLYYKTKDVYHKSPNSYFVAVDDAGNFRLIHVRNKTVFPKNAIIGDLTTLYDRTVKQEKVAAGRQTRKIKDDLKRQSEERKKQEMVKENELPTIPFERKPFFKT